MLAQDIQSAMLPPQHQGELGTSHGRVEAVDTVLTQLTVATQVSLHCVTAHLISLQTDFFFDWLPIISLPAHIQQFIIFGDFHVYFLGKLG